MGKTRGYELELLLFLRRASHRGVDSCGEVRIDDKVGGDARISQGGASIGGKIAGDVHVSRGNVNCGNVKGDVSVSMGNISSRGGITAGWQG
jgi:hypothetical protein